MAIDSQSAVLHSMSIFEMNEQSEFGKEFKFWKEI